MSDGQNRAHVCGRHSVQAQPSSKTVTTYTYAFADAIRALSTSRSLLHSYSTELVVQTGLYCILHTARVLLRGMSRDDRLVVDVQGIDPLPVFIICRRLIDKT